MSEESSKTLPKTPSQDSVFDKVWQEMEEVDPLTPLYNKCKGNCKCNCVKTEDALEAYKKAAKADDYLFGEYNGYEAYEEGH